MKLKKGLIAVLIAANLLMLVIGVITIPPNLRSAGGIESPVPRTELTAPVPAATGELIPVTTYSTYVFHKENDSLEIAGSDDNDTGGRIWISDSRFYGSQENGSDYIQSGSGNRYQRVK